MSPAHTEHRDYQETVGGSFRARRHDDRITKNLVSCHGEIESETEREFSEGWMENQPKAASSRPKDVRALCA